MHTNLRFHLKAGLKAVAFLFAVPVFWYTTIFFGTRFTFGAITGILSVLLAILASVVVYVIALSVLTKIVFGKVDLD